MQRIAPHLMNAGLKVGNVWLLEDSARRKFLIDTGHALERIPLMGQLFAMGVRAPGELTAVLLTHRHSDHAGNAAFVRKRLGARVICHENDAGALAGRVAPLPMLREPGSAATRAEGRQRLHERLLTAYEDRAPAYCEIDDTFTEGAWKWGFTVIPVPGHTEGSVMLYHEPSATLFSGDAIVTGHPLGRWIGEKLGLRSKELRLADPAFSQDAESCHLAVRRFLKHLPPVRYLCPGHGPAIDENTGSKLLRLLKTG